MEAHIIAKGKNEQLTKTFKEPIIDLCGNDTITFVVVEGGMASGQPSVLIITEDKEETVVLQTSLDKFMMGAQSMSGMAESRWGWARPEGYATIIPSSKEARKALLESIKKELEEWDEADKEGS